MEQKEMHTKKKICPICGGSGMDNVRSILHEEKFHETVSFYCNCWYGWLLKQRNESTMKVKVIPLKDVGEPWGMQDTGNFGRSDGRFFEDIAVDITVPKGREITNWRQPMREEKGPGAVVLVLSKRNNKVLVTARIEPGNPEELNHLLLGPTIQASKSNLDQAHGGERSPYTELLDEEKNIEWVGLWQDGGRNYKKLNYYTIIRIEEKDVCVLPNARWFSKEDLIQATIRGDVNEHLSQAIWLLTCMNMAR